MSIYYMGRKNWQDFWKKKKKEYVHQDMKVTQVIQILSIIKQQDNNDYHKELVKNQIFDK